MWIGVAAGVVLAVGLALFFGGSDRTSESEATLAAAPAPEPNSIAVLPFVNISGDETQEYFSDGISEELLNLLARIPGLKVISRTSAFSFKGQSLQIAEIARRLKVTHILEGSVRRGGDQVRITAQLIDAASDAPMWSQTYERTMEDIFAIQDEIAADVVAQLKVTLLGDLPTVEATDPEAYSLCLQAQHLGRLAAVGSVEQIIQLLQQALTLDPEFAAAWEESIAEYRTALSLNPGRLGTHNGLSQALLFQGEPEAALEAISQEPLEPVRLVGLAIVHHALKNRAESDAALSELIEKYERVAAGNIAGVLAFRGEVDRAFEWLDKAVQDEDTYLAELSVNPYFSNLHSDPRWLPLLRSLGKVPEQLAAIEFDLVLPE